MSLRCFFSQELAWFYATSFKTLHIKSINDKQPKQAKKGKHLLLGSFQMQWLQFFQSFMTHTTDFHTLTKKNRPKKCSVGNFVLLKQPIFSLVDVVQQQKECKSPKSTNFLITYLFKFKPITFKVISKKMLKCPFKMSRQGQPLP